MKILISLFIAALGSSHLVSAAPATGAAVSAEAFRNTVEKAIGEKYAAYEFRANELRKAHAKEIPAGMSKEEVVAVYGYTVNFYRTVNPMLRDGKAASIQPYVNVMDSALAKLPVYKGNVVRTTDLPAKVAKEYTAGKVITFPNYTSASTSAIGTGTDRFLIRSETARKLGALTAAPEEREVIFPRNAKFKILYKRVAKDGANEYVLAETAAE